MEQKGTGLAYRTIEIVQVALMAAIVYIATAFINVPSPYKGVVHLGDSMVFVSAILFGRKKGAAASAIGMSLFDLLSPYFYWSPFTFVIKGVMAYITGSIAYRKNYDADSVLNNIFAFVMAGIWMISAYYFGGAIISHYYFNMNISSSFILPLADIPGNIIQTVFGMLIATPLIKALKKANIGKYIR